MRVNLLSDAFFYSYPDIGDLERVVLQGKDDNQRARPCRILPTGFTPLIALYLSFIAGGTDRGGRET